MPRDRREEDLAGGGGRVSADGALARGAHDGQQPRRAPRVAAIVALHDGVRQPAGGAARADEHRQRSGRTSVGADHALAKPGHVGVERDVPRARPPGQAAILRPRRAAGAGEHHRAAECLGPCAPAPQAGRLARLDWR
eukprot:1721025-Prymnesium_polylepis.2